MMRSASAVHRGKECGLPGHAPAYLAAGMRSAETFGSRDIAPVRRSSPAPTARETAGRLYPGLPPGATNRRRLTARRAAYGTAPRRCGNVPPAPEYYGAPPREHLPEEIGKRSEE